MACPAAGRIGEEDSIRLGTTWPEAMIGRGGSGRDGEGLEEEVLEEVELFDMGGSDTSSDEAG